MNPKRDWKLGFTTVKFFKIAIVESEKGLKGLDGDIANDIEIATMNPKRDWKINCSSNLMCQHFDESEKGLKGVNVVNTTLPQPPRWIRKGIERLVLVLSRNDQVYLDESEKGLKGLSLRPRTRSKFSLMNPKRDWKSSPQIAPSAFSISMNPKRDWKWKMLYVHTPNAKAWWILKGIERVCTLPLLDIYLDWWIRKGIERCYTTSRPPW